MGKVSMARIGGRRPRKIRKSPRIRIKVKKAVIKLPLSRLPDDIRSHIEHIRTLRKIRTAGIVSTATMGGVTALQFTLGERGYPKLMGGATFASAMTLAGTQGFIIRETNKLGASLRNSNDNAVNYLRTQYRYMYVDRKGNLVGTNRKPIIGRKRMAT